MTTKSNLIAPSTLIAATALDGQTPFHGSVAQFFNMLKIEDGTDLRVAAEIAVLTGKTTVPPDQRVTVAASIRSLHARAKTAIEGDDFDAGDLGDFDVEELVEAIETSATMVETQTAKTGNGAGETATAEQALAAATIDKATGVDKVVGTS